MSDARYYVRWGATKGQGLYARKEVGRLLMTSEKKLATLFSKSDAIAFCKERDTAWRIVRVKSKTTTVPRGEFVEPVKLIPHSGPIRIPPEVLERAKAILSGESIEKPGKAKPNFGAVNVPALIKKLRRLRKVEEAAGRIFYHTVAETGGQGHKPKWFEPLRRALFGQNGPDFDDDGWNARTLENAASRVYYCGQCKKSLASCLKTRSCNPRADVLDEPPWAIAMRRAVDRINAQDKSDATELCGDHGCTLPKGHPGSFEYMIETEEAIARMQKEENKSNPQITSDEATDLLAQGRKLQDNLAPRIVEMQGTHIECGQGACAARACDVHREDVDEPTAESLAEMPELAEGVPGRPNPYVSSQFVSETCRGESCHIVGCENPASAKVGEEIASDDPYPNRHNLTAYVCDNHFRAIMGQSGVEFVANLRADMAATKHLIEIGPIPIKQIAKSWVNGPGKARMRLVSTIENTRSFDARDREALAYLLANGDLKSDKVRIPDSQAVILAKAVLAAHQALNIDMGDGEPTFQCCNTVCAHSRCLIGEALLVAEKISVLTEADIASMNYARAMGGLQPPLGTTTLYEGDEDALEFDQPELGK